MTEILRIAFAVINILMELMAIDEQYYPRFVATFTFAADLISGREEHSPENKAKLEEMYSYVNHALREEYLKREAEDAEEDLTT